MQNILILYNPYYQKDVIQKHLQVLKECGAVAFGKVQSKFRDMQNPSQNELEQIYQNVSENDFLQLFLSDYSILYVAKVVRVINGKLNQNNHAGLSKIDNSNLGELNLNSPTNLDANLAKIAPKYYAQNNLNVEKWFIVSDLRELARDDFSVVRDNFLSDFKVLAYGGHTFAIYGNAYVYPLIIYQKSSRNYFENQIKFYLDIYKSDDFLAIKNALINYCFGLEVLNMILFLLSSNILRRLSARFANLRARFFAKLGDKNSQILNIKFTIQEREFCIADIFHMRPNLGTFQYLFRHHSVKRALLNGRFYDYIKKMCEQINEFKELRNHAVHERKAKFDEICSVREKILGVRRNSFLIPLIKIRSQIAKEKF